MATRRLGRGLDGLLPSAPSAAPKPTGGTTAMIEQLHPNRDQPRRHFDDDALQELADSIAAHGVLEPILVRKHFHVYETIIPRNIRLAEAPSHGKPVILYDAASRGSFQYLNLAREILDALPIQAA